ncbi:MAG: sodium:solute symporter family protein [Bacteroidetes bacterium]|nr:sodium:solute symporter family protein [Bacteroidota bacterium]
MTLLQFSPADWLIVAAYLLFLLFLGFRGSALSRGTQEEYILGGRMLTLPGFVAALVSTWYGGILGVGEFSYLYGIANWFVFGLPYYIFAMVFAVFFARKVRDTGLYSIPDQLYARYDRKTGLLGSVLVFFNSSPAPYILMLAVLLQVVTGWPLFPSLLIGTAVSVIYVYAGGFRSVVRTDLLQFLLMFGGFFVLLSFLILDYGLLPFLTDHLPDDHLTVTGGNSWQYILVWFFIALWTLVAPQFHQFTLSAKSPRIAQRGIVVSVACWFVFDSITTLSGLYARALLPALGQPSMAYPLLAEQTLPAIAKGIFYVGMLATVMSTTDGLTFIAGLTAGRDILATLTGRRDDRSVTRYTQYGVLFTAVISIAGVLLFPSVISLWYVIGTLFIPALLLPLAASYYPQLTVSASRTFWAMLTGFLVSLLALLAGRLASVDGEPRYPFGIEPMYDGLAATLGIYLPGWLRRKKKNAPGGMRSDGRA